ncbi:hypothetical protein [Curtobacterium sp. MCPF17_031]|uniref:hypothetical protein n=1 Tax=Curtobacterium sp. MCPF17_031 TaxID=2175653 RepID=UPI0011B634AE|nr:hypothetical protein [Curtobacterium sp. MCPF17_031]
MNKNVKISLITLVVGVPMLVGSMLQAQALFALADRTGLDPSVGAFTFILVVASTVTVVFGIGFALTAFVQHVERSRTPAAH